MRIKEGLFYKDARRIDYGIVHLYEHLAIENFYIEIHQAGLTDGIWGWLDGESFYPGHIRVSAGFYDLAIWRKFLKYIKRPINLDAEIVKKEIRRIEAEDHVEIDYDIKKVIRQLEKLNQSPFISLNGRKDLVYHYDKPSDIEPRSKYLVSQKNQRKFQDFGLRIGIDNPSKTDIEIFSRMSVLVSDVVSGYLARQFDAYQYDHLTIYFDKKTLNKVFRTSQQTVFKKAYDEQAIVSGIMNELRRVDFVRLRRQLKKFIVGYYSGGVNNDFPFEHYENSGMLASKYHIYKIFTPENVQKVWDKLVVEIEKIK